MRICRELQENFGGGNHSPKKAASTTRIRNTIKLRKQAANELAFRETTMLAEKRHHGLLARAMRANAPEIDPLKGKVTEEDHATVFSLRTKISKIFNELPPDKEDFLEQRERRFHFYARGPASKLCLSAQDEVNRQFRSLYPLISSNVIATLNRENSLGQKLIAKLALEKKIERDSAPTFTCLYRINKTKPVKRHRLRTFIRIIMAKAKKLNISMKFFVELGLFDSRRGASKMRKLMRMIQSKDYYKISFYLRDHPFLLYRVLPSGRTVIHHLVSNKDYRGLSIMMAYCKDPDVFNRSKRTPLEIAIDNSDQESALILLKSGADIFTSIKNTRIQTQSDKMNAILNMYLMKNIVCLMVNASKAERISKEIQIFIEKNLAKQRPVHIMPSFLGTHKEKNLNII